MIFFSNILSIEINDAINFSTFSSCMKISDLPSVFKKEIRSEKYNYHPVNILPNLSKIFFKFFLFLKIFFQNIIIGLEKAIAPVDQGKVFGPFSDLSQVSDCLLHDLYSYIAKLQTFGFDNKSLALVKDYLLKMRHRTNVGQEFSTWQEIQSGISHGSIHGLIFFNIYLLFSNYYHG